MICKECGKEFEDDWRSENTDKKRNPPSFCSKTCYKKHNGKIATYDTIFCAKCGSETTKRRGTKKIYCSACKNELHKKYRRESGLGSSVVKTNRIKTKYKAIELKGNKCSICGYDKYQGALEFHHINPDEKEFQISGTIRYGWEKVKVELEKCILVCSNCHKEIHAGLINI